MARNASDSISRTKSERENVVIVPRPVARTKSGGANLTSRRSLIRQARKMRPQFTDSAVTEMHYGTSESIDTVVVFDPSKSAVWGMR